MVNWLARVFGYHVGALEQSALVFDGWRTKCSNCGGSARAEEQFHEHNYAGAKRGCGARFTGFTVANGTTESEIRAHQAVRRDLPYVPIEVIDTALNTGIPTIGQTIDIR